MSEVFMTDGTLIKVASSDSPPAYTTVPGVMNITPPSRTRKVADVYIHDQSAPVSKTGAYEAQEVSFEMAYDPGDTTQDGLFTAQAAKTTQYWKIVFPTSPTSTIAFSGVISALEFQDASAEGTDPLKVNVTVRLASDFTLT